MMQSNAENCESFVQKAVVLRKLTQQKSHFIWISKHQKCFGELLQYFIKDTPRTF